MKRAERPQRQLARVLVLVFVFGLAFIVVGWIVVPDQHADFWVDVMSAGVQLAVVTGLGVVVNVTLNRVEAVRKQAQQDRDRELEERRRIDERRLRMFRDLVASYNHVKAVRRNLRTLGLFDSDALNAGQVAGLRSQMTLLIEAQLSIEAIGREFDADSLTFPEHSRLHGYTNTVETYLHDVIKQWECHGGVIWANVEHTKMQALDALHAFIGDTDRGFKENVMDPMRELRSALRSQLLERPSREESDESND